MDVPQVRKRKKERGETLKNCYLVGGQKLQVERNLTARTGKATTERLGVHDQTVVSSAATHGVYRNSRPYSSTGGIFLRSNSEGMKKKKTIKY
jgi:hypothetical protein